MKQNRNCVKLKFRNFNLFAVKVLLVLMVCKARARKESREYKLFSIGKPTHHQPPAFCKDNGDLEYLHKSHIVTKYVYSIQKLFCLVRNILIISSENRIHSTVHFQGFLSRIENLVQGQISVRLVLEQFSREALLDNETQDRLRPG